MSLITVKVDNDPKKYKYIPVIKSFSNKSIGDIKEKIDKDLPVISCDYILEADRLKELRTVLRSLQDMGANITIFQKKELINFDLLDNLIASHQQTVEQIEKEDERFDI